MMSSISMVEMKKLDFNIIISSLRLIWNQFYHSDYPLIREQAHFQYLQNGSSYRTGETLIESIHIRIMSGIEMFETV